jgi:hypothetical protein
LTFANCLDPQAVGLETLATGDDAFSVINYTSGANNNGGFAAMLHLKNSKGNGIKIAGQSDFIVSDFEIDGTASDGVIVTTDSGYGTQVPARVTVQKGQIKNVGAVTPHAGNQAGIEFTAVGAGIVFRDIQIFAPLGRGVSGIAASGEVTIENIKVVGSGNDGAFQLSAQTLTAHNLIAINPTAYAVYISGCTTLVAAGLKSIKALGGLNRAMWFADNTSVAIDGIDVIDMANPAVSYIVGYSGATAGYMTDVNGFVPHGTFTPPVSGALKIGTTVIAP